MTSHVLLALFLKRFVIDLLKSVMKQNHADKLLNSILQNHNILATLALLIN